MPVNRAFVPACSLLAADALREASTQVSADADRDSTIAYIAVALARRFSATCPDFHRDRFLDAAVSPDIVLEATWVTP